MRTRSGVRHQQTKTKLRRPRLAVEAEKHPRLKSSAGISNQALNAVEITGVIYSLPVFNPASNLMAVMDIRTDWTWLIIIITIIIIPACCGARDGLLQHSASSLLLE